MSVVEESFTSLQRKRRIVWRARPAAAPEERRRTPARGRARPATAWKAVLLQRPKCGITVLRVTRNATRHDRSSCDAQVQRNARANACGHKADALGPDGVFVTFNDRQADVLVRFLRHEFDVGKCEACHASLNIAPTIVVLRTAQ